MDKVQLGKTDISVTRLAFGGCPMGRHGWGNVARQDFVETVQHALDLGLTFFDTADTYGLGESEATLGDALRGRREEAVIATKFGVRVTESGTQFDNSPKWIRSALEASLRRLQTDYVDLYQVHYRDGTTPLSDIVETLGQLADEGKIRAIGLSNVGPTDLTEILSTGSRFSSFQNELSLANRSGESFMKSLSAATGMTPLSWGSLGQGILTGKYGANATFSAADRRSRPEYVNFHGKKLAQNLRIVEVMRQISERTGRSLPAIAVRWILDSVPGSVAIAGIKNEGQLRSNVDALGWTLSLEDLEALNLVSEPSESGQLGSSSGE